MINLSNYDLKYSRQIQTLGVEANYKLNNFEVFIYGMRSLGVEVAKQAILSGVKKVFIFDNKINNITDLSSNAFIQESNVGKLRRDFAVLNQLKEINKDTIVEIAMFDPFKDINQLRLFHVVCFTEIVGSNFICQVDELLREYKRCFIYGCISGLSGFIFTDFGKEYLIKDENDIESKSYPIKSISKSQPGIVTIDENELSYNEGDYVIIKEVTGMAEVCDAPPRPIKIVSSNQFSIENTSKYSDYSKGGLVERVKIPRPVFFQSLKELILSNEINKKITTLDDNKLQMKETLHLLYQGLFLIYDTYNTIPVINSEEKFYECLNLLKKAFNNKKSNDSIEFNENYAKNFILTLGSQIGSMATILGGIMGQELMKFTGKYTPIDQFLYFDFYETSFLTEEFNVNLNNPSQYHDLNLIYGEETVKTMQTMKVLLIGAGGIGGEFLKLLSLYGCSSKKAKITVVDNSIIGISDLNRQFMIKPTDISKTKCEKMALMIENINKNIDVQIIQMQICEENEDIFNHMFWEKQDIIISCVNTIESRIYIDKQCVLHNKILIDLGVSSSRGHMQVFIPNLTNTYNDLEDEANEIITKIIFNYDYFPFTFDNCIAFANSLFYKIFVEDIDDFLSILKEGSCDQFINQIKSNLTLSEIKEKLVRLDYLVKILIQTESRRDLIIDYAYHLYSYYFIIRIKELINCFPEDYLDEEERRFWIGKKRFPTDSLLKITDEHFILFIFSFCNIFNKNICKIPINEVDIRSYLENKITNEQIIFQKYKYKLTEEYLDNDITSTNDPYVSYNENEDEIYQNIQLFQKFITDNILSKYSNGNSGNISNQYKIKPIEFLLELNPEQFDFIYATSMIKAKIYKINDWSKLKTLMFSGNINPSLSSVVSVMAGLGVIQFMNVVNLKTLNKYRDAYIDIGNNFYVFVQPGEKKDISINENCKKWTKWDKIEIKETLTINQLLDRLDKDFKIVESNCIFKSIHVYESKALLSLQECDNDTKEKLVDSLLGKVKADYTYLTISIVNDSEGVIELPVIKYYIK